jgi:2-keto-4-pentenoate hydratase
MERFFYAHLTRFLTIVRNEESTHMTVHIDNAAKHIVAARQAGVPGGRIPEADRPTTPEEALAVQDKVTALLGQEIGGWKCSLPSDGKIIAAPIYAVDITKSAPKVWDAGTKARIEPEIAYILKTDLPPRGTPYSEEEVRAAIGSTHLVLELIGARYADITGYSFPEMLADRLQNQGVFIGPEIDQPWEKEMGTFPITITGKNGVVSTHKGVHPNEHPFKPFFWLANFLNTRQTGLRAGQVVITGSYDGVIPVPFDEELTFQFGDNGTLTTTLSQLRK